MKQRDKKGISPIITTISLILIVIVLATIISLWGFAFIPEALTKGETAIASRCSEVGFDAVRDGGDILVSNTRNVAIYRFDILKNGRDSSDTSQGEALNLNPSSSGTITGLNLNGIGSIILVPVLLGETDSGKIQEYPCRENSNSWKTINL